MKQLFLFFFLIGVFIVNGQNPVPPALGDGSVDDPYQISTLDHLAWLSDPVLGELDKHYVQTANIEAASTVLWNESAGFDPIGTYSDPFIGSYDGAFYTISGLTINRPLEAGTALFGYVNGTLQRCVLLNVNILGYEKTGGLVGNLMGGQAIQCKTTGTVKGYMNTGGLIGTSIGSINQCASSCDVISVYMARAGGLLGILDATTCSNSYFDGQVRNENTGNMLGGLCEYLINGTVEKCYSTGVVNNGVNMNAGLIRDYHMTYGCLDSFWDVVTSGQTSSLCGTPLSPGDFLDQTIFENAGWNFDDVWEMSGDKSNGPVLQWEANIGLGAGSGATSTPLNANVLWAISIILLSFLGFRKLLFNN